MRILFTSYFLKKKKHHPEKLNVSTIPVDQKARKEWGHGMAVLSQGDEAAEYRGQR